MKNRLTLNLLPAVLLLVTLASCRKAAPEGETDQPGAARQNLLYEEDFEGATPFSTAHSVEVGAWDYAMNFVSDPPAFEGRKSVRFEIREDQELVKTGKRAEACIVKGSDGEVGKEAWYSYAVLCPSVGFEYDTDREIINQWYQDGSPSMTIRTEEDRFLLEAGNDPDERKEYDLGAIKKDSWTTFVMHVIHSFGSDGLIEIWRDGVKTVTVNGGNMYDGILPKFKVGLYKSGFKYDLSLVDRRVIYFDNIRVGNEKATYRDMIPGKLQ